MIFREAKQTEEQTEAYRKIPHLDGPEGGDQALLHRHNHHLRAKKEHVTTRAKQTLKKVKGKLGIRANVHIVVQMVDPILQ
jgi:hypothetical protein